MTISFNQIPSNIRVPLFYAEIDNSGAVSGLVEQPFRVLMIGQRLTSGTKAALDLQLITSKENAKTYFGAGSVLADMLVKFLETGSTAELYAIALDDLLAGVKATGKISFVGSAPTAAGTVKFLIGGRAISLGVTTADTPASLATALVALINADTDCVVTAVVNGTNNYEVDLTARNKGEHGNEINVRHSHYLGEALPTGTAVTITAMSGGSGNPDVTAVWPIIGDTQFLLMVTPFTDAANMTAVETELDSRFGPTKMNDGYAIYGKRASHASLVTFGGTRNSKYSTTLGVVGPSSPWHFAAQAAGQVSISVIADDAARPFHTLAMTALIAPKKTERFTLAERDILLHNGIATFDVDAGDVCRLEGMVTMYRLNAFGSPDPSYLYLNTPLLLSYLRFSSKARMTQKFGRHKLANDGTRFAPGQAVVTPNVIKAEYINLFKQWEEKALVEGFDQFKEDLVVERDPNNPNRVNVLLPPDIVNQLIIMGVSLRFLL